MDTNIKNLKTVYDAATGEIPKDKKALEYYWPIIHSIQEISFLLEKSSRSKTHKIEEEQLAKILLAIEGMAYAAERKENIPICDIPLVNSAPGIKETLE